MSKFFCKVIVFAIATFMAGLLRGNNFTSSSYSRDGLIANWDGLENVFPGETDLDTTLWKDTINGKIFTLTNVVREVNGFKFKTSYSSYGILSDLDTRATFEAAKNGTVEIVIKGVDQTQRVALESSPASGIMLGLTGANSMATCVAKRPLGVFSWINDIYTISTYYSAAASQQPSYTNGVLAKASTTQSTFGNGNRTTVIGCRNNFTKNAFNGTIYAIRLYSRRLTDSEIKHNAMIDKIRFHEASPEETVNIDGYRYDSSTGKILVRVLIDFDASLGTVTTNGVAVENEMWLELGSVPTFRAEPGTNKSFSHWDLPDNRGKSFDDSYTWTANVPMVLTAKFLKNCYVTETGAGDMSGSSWENATNDFIGAALDFDAKDGGTVYVAPGYYTNTFDLTARPTLTNSTRIIAFSPDKENPATHYNTTLDLRNGYGFALSNDTARLSGFLITNSLHAAGAAHGSAVALFAGRLDNCRFDGAKKKQFLSTVRVSGGLFSDSIVTNFTSVNNADAAGGIVYVTAGVVSNVVFVNNTAMPKASLYTIGNPVITHCDFFGNKGTGALHNYTGNASIRHCRIMNNTVTQGPCDVYNGGDTPTYSDCIIANNISEQCGVTRARYANIIFDRCIITNNVGAVHGVCTLSDSSARFRNCLIADNLGKTGAGVCSLSLNTIEFSNCTIVGNRTASGTIHGIYLNYKSHTVKNCIVWGNGNGGTEQNLTVGANVTTANFANNCYPEAATDGRGQMAMDPCFNSAATSDYRLRYVSPCLDVGTEIFAVDLEGRMRPVAANVGSAIKSDLGCYEMPLNPNPVNCAIKEISATVGVAPLTLEATAAIVGQNLVEIQYKWKAVRRNDGEVFEADAGSGESAVFTGLPVGEYDISLEVSTGDGASDSNYLYNALIVRADTTYVSNDGAHIWPYDTPQNASTNFVDAITWSGRKVVVAEGTYYGAKMERDIYGGVTPCVLACNRKIEIAGSEDPSKTVIDCAGNANWYGVYIGQNALFHGFMITNGSTVESSGGSIIAIGSAVVSNCVVQGGAGGVRLSGNALFTDGVISNLFIPSDKYVALSMSSARLYNSRLANLTGQWNKSALMTDGSTIISNCVICNTKSANNSIDISGTTLIADCLITNNNATTSSSYAYMGHGGIYSKGSLTMERCKLIGNYASRIGAIGNTDGTVVIKDCLIVGNYTTRSYLTGGIYATAAATTTIRNCTIVSNKTLAASTAGGVYAASANCKITDCLIWDNVYQGTDAETGATVLTRKDVGGTPQVRYSCYSEADPANVEGNIGFGEGFDPKIRYRGRNMYHLRIGSPCIDAGDRATDRNESDKDLAGNPRVRCGRIDMGCYEEPSGGFKVIVR